MQDTKATVKATTELLGHDLRKEMREEAFWQPHLLMLLPSDTYI